MILFKGMKFKKIGGIALWPFVFLKTKTPYPLIINHERIHLRQQIEMLVIPFYIWYIAEWAIRFASCRNFDHAYRHIGFEKEAYAMETDLNYLEKRKFWAFLKFL
jgi:hypothetical protein